MIEHFLISVISGIGMATILVEKGDDFPVRYFRNALMSVTVKFFGESWYELFACTVCMSFWAALLCEIFMYFTVSTYFTWPLSGFTASGITFYVIDFLNILEKRKK